MQVYLIFFLHILNVTILKRNMILSVYIIYSYHTFLTFSLLCSRKVVNIIYGTIYKLSYKYK